MRVLVTGAAGFIGTAVVRALLDAGAVPIALVRSARAADRVRAIRDDVAIATADLDDAVAVDRALAEHKPEGAIHLAWYAAPGVYWTSPENLTCVANTLSFAQAFARHGGRRFVGAGTCAEYDWSHETLDEMRTPCRPHTLYGAAKYATFVVLEQFALQMDLSFAWARYNFLYGAHEAPRRLVSSLIDGLRAGETVACTDGLQQRDFMHVDDAARATVAVLTNDVTGPVNIATGKMVEVRELIATLQRLIGGPGRADLGARPRAANDPAVLRPTVDRLHTTGFRPRFDLETGLADAIGRR